MSEGIAYPSQLLFWRFAIERNHIEAADRRLVTWLYVFFKKGLRYVSNSRHFARCYRFQRVAESTSPALADFDEHEFFTIAHDEVDLPSARAKVALHKLKTVFLQPPLCASFKRHTASKAPGWRIAFSFAQSLRRPQHWLGERR